MTIDEIEDLISKHGSITAQPLRDLVVTVVLECTEVWVHHSMDEREKYETGERKLA